MEFVASYMAIVYHENFIVETIQPIKRFSEPKN